MRAVEGAKEADPKMAHEWEASRAFLAATYKHASKAQAGISVLGLCMVKTRARASTHTRQGEMTVIPDARVHHIKWPCECYALNFGAANNLM